MLNVKPLHTQTMPLNSIECDYTSVNRTVEFVLQCKLNSKQASESFQRNFLKLAGPLAQLVEQQTLNLWVEGSIPSWLSEEKKVIFFFLMTTDTHQAGNLC